MRELWDATRALLGTRPGGFETARGLLHREALDATLGGGAPEVRDARLAGLVARLPPRLVDPAREALGRDGLDAGPLAIEALEALHEVALAQLDAAAQARSNAATRRTAAVLGLVLGCALGAVVAVDAVARWSRPLDLARGKPWKASSSMAECLPAEGRCGAVRTKVFFHTNEEPSPWVELDLGAVVPFSSLTVVNRGDMLMDRAIPLVVELSDDQASWREVARRKELFATWEAALGQQAARYVRLRVDRRSTLHLEAVEVRR